MQIYYWLGSTAGTAVGPVVFQSTPAPTGWYVRSNYTSDQSDAGTSYQVLVHTNNFFDFSAVEALVRSAIKTDAGTRYSTTITDDQLFRILV